MTKILLYNRKTKSLEKEVVTGRLLMRMIYSNRFGLRVTERFLKNKGFSVWYGNLLKKDSSKKRIPAFIKQHNIPIEEILDDIKSFKSFNDFFIRKLKPSAREIDHQKNVFISPADARLIVYQLDETKVVPVKGVDFHLDQIIKDKELSEKYKNGLCFVFRLAPADYHRFCYVDSGSHRKILRLGQYYHSVHPIALSSKAEVFQHNHREFCEVKTDNFDDILWIDVGAMGVSKIIQNHPESNTFKKGDEKGYFEFGGSTIIIITKKDVVQLDDDIQEYSSKGIETKVLYGSGIGKKRVSGEG